MVVASLVLLSSPLWLISCCSCAVRVLQYGRQFLINFAISSMPQFVLIFVFLIHFGCSHYLLDVLHILVLLYTIIYLLVTLRYSKHTCSTTSLHLMGSLTITIVFVVSIDILKWYCLVGKRPLKIVLVVCY